jgi:D-psicose/D-tagatose/L-ribulose 3-epimerase
LDTEATENVRRAVPRSCETLGKQSGVDASQHTVSERDRVGPEANGQMTKFAVSNIAWDWTEEDAVLRELQNAGVTGIEVAPTKVWPDWSGATPKAAGILRQRLADRGFFIPALQSVLFGRSALRLFGDRAARLALREHLAMVGRLAYAIGARAMVFGSPQNRDRGLLPSRAAMDQAVEFFSDVGSALSPMGVALCIEANPPAYQCNFLTRWHEAAELVQRVHSPGIALHFDVACTVLAGDDPIVAIQDCEIPFAHFHISEPLLGAFYEPRIDHAAVGKALRERGYQGWLSIEMRRHEDPVRALREAIRNAKDCYGRA